MSAPIRRPAPRPCDSCPYRRDVPSGIWAPEEYAKLPAYDEPTYAQPTRVFLCHQQDGRVCAGWAGCHDGAQLLALRIAVSDGSLTVADFEATVDYVSPVSLFSSGSEAAAHGRAEVEEPREPARVAIAKLVQRRGGAA